MMLFVVTMLADRAAASGESAETGETGNGRLPVAWPGFAELKRSLRTFPDVWFATCAETAEAWSRLNER